MEESGSVCHTTPTLCYNSAVLQVVLVCEIKRFLVINPPTLLKPYSFTVNTFFQRLVVRSLLRACVCVCVWMKRHGCQPPSSYDRFGIKATQHPAGKSNSRTRHYPTQPHSFLCPGLSHYSPYQPPLSPPDVLSLCPFSAPPPSSFLPLSSPAHSLSPLLSASFSPNTKGPQNAATSFSFIARLSVPYPLCPRARATQEIVISPPPWYPPLLNPKWNGHRYASLCLALINFDTHTMNNESDTDDRENGGGEIFKDTVRVVVFWSGKMVLMVRLSCAFGFREHAADSQQSRQPAVPDAHDHPRPGEWHQAVAPGEEPRPLGPEGGRPGQQDGL